MSMRFVACLFVVVGLAFSSQADAQIFRRWGPPPQPSPQQQMPRAQAFAFPQSRPPQALAAQRYTQPQNYGQQYNPAGQYAVQRTTTQYARPECQQQQRLVFAPVERQQQVRQQQPNLERQILNAQYDLSRRRQLISQLQASLFQQNSRRVANGYLPSTPVGIYQAPVVAQRQSQVLAAPYVSGRVVSSATSQTAVNVASNQVDIAREMATPVLSGPEVTSNVVSGESVALIQPAVETPTGTLKDEDVVPVSATSSDEPASEISILDNVTEPAQEKSILEKMNNSILEDTNSSILEAPVDEIIKAKPAVASEPGVIELNGPASGK